MVSHIALHVVWWVTLCYMLYDESHCVTCWMVSHIVLHVVWWVTLCYMLYDESHCVTRWMMSHIASHVGWWVTLHYMLDGESHSWSELTLLNERQSLNEQNDFCSGSCVGEANLTRHVISCWFVGTGHES